MTRNHTLRQALTLPELLAVLAIVAALSILLVPRVAGNAADANQAGCNLNQGEIELQAQLWRRATGAFPLSDLSDIGGSTAYFPSGLPTCPVDGSVYTVDPADGTVIGHDHE